MYLWCAFQRPFPPRTGTWCGWSYRNEAVENRLELKPSSDSLPGDGRAGAENCLRRCPTGVQLQGKAFRNIACEKHHECPRVCSHPQIGEEFVETNPLRVLEPPAYGTIPFVIEHPVQLVAQRL